MDQIDALDGVEGRYWQMLPDGKIQCDLCPRECKLSDGRRGLCFVRARRGDGMVLTTYGRSSGFCIDPSRDGINNIFDYAGKMLLHYADYEPNHWSHLF